LFFGGDLVAVDLFFGGGLAAAAPVRVQIGTRDPVAGNPLLRGKIPGFPLDPCTRRREALVAVRRR
jgi:hypothetical protein